MFWEIFVLLVSFLALERRWRLRRQFAMAKQLKTSIRSYPIIGHSLMFIGSDEDRMRTFEVFGKDAIKSGGITPLWQPNELFICVADPMAAEIILNQCLEKHEIGNTFRFIIGGASLLAPVPVWRSRRKLIVPTFNTKNFSKYTEIFTKQSTIMANKIEKEVDQGPFSFWDYIGDYHLDSTCETTLGIDLNTQGVQKYTLKTAIEELLELIAWRVCQPWLRSDFIFERIPSYKVGLKHRKTVHDFISKIIKEKQNLSQNKKSNCETNTEIKEDVYSFLDVQLEVAEEQRFTEKQLLEEITGLFLASSATTATGSAFTVLMLSKRPDIQDKVFEELQEVFGNSNHQVTSKDLPRLKYLEAVIKESLRLYPPAPLFVRRADKDVNLPSGIIIVKDCGILVNIWAIHRHPAYWGADADQFRPERFLERSLTHPAAFMAFGSGPRNCIGYQYAMMSIKTAVATLIRRYKVLPFSHSEVRNEEPERTKYDLMLRHVDNFKIRLEKRK